MSAEFPVMAEKDLPTLPRSVPWAFVAPHEARALKNHDQTLKRLAERGGLCWTELRDVILDKPWDFRTFHNGEPRYLRIHLTAAAAYVVMEKLAQFQATPPPASVIPSGTDTGKYTEETCPCHVASENDPMVCGRCGTHADSLR